MTDTEPNDSDSLRRSELVDRLAAAATDGIAAYAAKRGVRVQVWAELGVAERNRARMGVLAMFLNARPSLDELARRMP